MSSGQETIRILIVDDIAETRESLRKMLYFEPDMEVVGTARNGQEAIELAGKHQPHVVLMDINMPVCDGLEATRRIKRELPHISIVMLTVADDNQDIFEAIKSGAQGYLLKNLEPSQLYELLESISRNEAPLSGVIAAKILKEFTQPSAETNQEAELADKLTSREISILELIVAGLTNKEIGAELFISENTVKIHLRNILDKLHLQNRIQAAVYAVRKGLVDDEA
jgi:DNA-binding NarL/FixJ family response regulator